METKVFSNLLEILNSPEKILINKDMGTKLGWILAVSRNPSYFEYLPKNFKNIDFYKDLLIFSKKNTISEKTSIFNNILKYDDLNEDILNLIVENIGLSPIYKKISDELFSDSLIEMHIKLFPTDWEFLNHSKINESPEYYYSIYIDNLLKLEKKLIVFSSYFIEFILTDFFNKFELFQNPVLFLNKLFSIIDIINFNNKHVSYELVNNLFFNSYNPKIKKEILRNKNIQETLYSFLISNPKYTSYFYDLIDVDLILKIIVKTNINDFPLETCFNHNNSMMEKFFAKRVVNLFTHQEAIIELINDDLKFLSVISSNQYFFSFYSKFGEAWNFTLFNTFNDDNITKLAVFLYLNKALLDESIFKNIDVGSFFKKAISVSDLQYYLKDAFEFNENLTQITSLFSSKDIREALFETNETIFYVKYFLINYPEAFDYDLIEKLVINNQIYISDLKYLSQPPAT